MTEERFKDLESRMRKVEDFILGQLSMLLELSQSLKGRVEVLEEHDVEFMNMVHNTCTLKDKEIQKNREEAIKIATDHANNNHKQTLAMIVFMFTLFMGATVYFNNAHASNALEIQKNSTNTENLTKLIDKIDSKIDRLSDAVEKKVIK